VLLPGKKPKACDLAKVANAFEVGHVIFVQARKVLVHAKLHLLYLSIAWPPL